MQAGLTSKELANITSQYDLHYRVGHAGSVGVSGFTLGMNGPSFGDIAKRIVCLEIPAGQATIKNHNRIKSWPAAIDV